MSNPQYKHIGSPLTRLIEEMSEAIQVACKIDRFGWFNYHPNDPNMICNMELLKREMEDVFNVYSELEKRMIVIKHNYYLTQHTPDLKPPPAESNS